MATHSNILAWKNPTDEESGELQSHGIAKELDTTERQNNNEQQVHSKADKNYIR